MFTIIYEINKELMNLVNPKTGEILGIDAFERLQIERLAKVEGVALWYKNLCAEAAAIKAEENALADRRKLTENKAESLKKYLNYALQGVKFSTPRVEVSFIKTNGIMVVDEPKFVAWAKVHNPALLVSNSKPNEAAIKAAINRRVRIPFVTITEVKTISIK